MRVKTEYGELARGCTECLNEKEIESLTQQLEKVEKKNAILMAFVESSKQAEIDYGDAYDGPDVSKVLEKIKELEG